MTFRRKPPAGNVRRVACLGHNLRGITTNKRGHVVQFESELEHTLILLLERDPSVDDYHSQPEVLSFVDATGRARTYTPDFQVWRTDGRIELHEVSVETRCREHPSLRQREAAAATICQDRGWEYIVHTDRSLPSGYEYTNLSFLSGYRAQCSTDPAVTTAWLRQLGQEPRHPQMVLAQLAADQATGSFLAGLYHLLWHGSVQMDWHSPLIQGSALHPAARIWLADQAVSQ